jgi:hypothetical protein
MKNDNNRCALAATCAVAAELSRRGYDVAFTLGNVPRLDLIASVPDGQPFKIQVKGIRNQNGLWVQSTFFKAKPQDDLFLIIVLMAKPNIENSALFRFFILSHRQAIAEGKAMPVPFEQGLNWGPLKKYENRWDTLPPLP